MRESAHTRRREASPDPAFRFVDLFAGIGGIRAGLEGARGRCEYSVENNDSAVATYEANWDAVDEGDIRDVDPEMIPHHEIMAAGFPCQPFSLAGVSMKNHLKRRHGFDDPTSGNLFFQIVRLIGGPWEEEATIREAYSDAEGREEEEEFQASEPASEKSPPVLLLENVRNLVSHDEKRTFRVIRRRLMRSGYRVSHAMINGAVWVPQNRRRVIIVALRADLFPSRFEFKSPGDDKHGPKLDGRVLATESADLERYRLTPGVWNALQRHRAKHEAKGAGFGFGIARPGDVTRTLSARYYKDGAEILIEMSSGDRPRRLTPRECANLMGFTDEELGFEFQIPVSDRQAYQQFGNSVVVPQFRWIGEQIVGHAGEALTKHMTATSPG